MEEIEHIRSYLKIQKARYKDKLNYTLAIAPDIQDIFVLKLVLQPIVENAIYHGIKERRGPGHILIEAKKDNEQLMIRVTDDGSGMPNEILYALRKRLATALNMDEENRETKNLGYGMMNVQARIKLTFGDAYGLSIDSEKGEGTTVTAILPIIREK
jgi:two-component system sensor histidine kinase YesM